ncbi:MAG: Rieske (2Fe-2S) protein [Thaumarchaeota archaeon]|nr:Rieske (2Fe-2S) protein [Nitrososphaerota archaeon]
MNGNTKMKRHPVCKSEELTEGSIMKVTVGMEDIMIGRKNGRLFACNNSCPHKGASLSKGHMNGDNIVCYMHGYEYNVFSGKLEDMKSWKKEPTWVEQDEEWRKSGDLFLYPISEENGMVYVSLKEAQP